MSVRHSQIWCVRKIIYTPFFTPYVNWRICLDFTQFSTHALRLRQFRDTLISNSNQASSSNPILNEEFMNQENLHQRLVIKLYVYNSYAITACIYSVHIQTLLLSCPYVHFQSMGREDCEKTSVRDNFRGINDNLVE